MPPLEEIRFLLQAARNSYANMRRNLYSAGLSLSESPPPDVVPDLDDALHRQDFLSALTQTKEMFSKQVKVLRVLQRREADPKAKEHLNRAQRDAESGRDALKDLIAALEQS